MIYLLSLVICRLMAETTLPLRFSHALNAGMKIPERHKKR